MPASGEPDGRRNGGEVMVLRGDGSINAAFRGLMAAPDRNPPFRNAAAAEELGEELTTDEQKARANRAVNVRNAKARSSLVWLIFTQERGGMREVWSC